MVDVELIVATGVSKDEEQGEQEEKKEKEREEPERILRHRYLIWFGRCRRRTTAG